MDPHSSLKHRAAQKAADFVKDGMIIGLGTGSTANYLIEELGRRVKDGLKIAAIATSKRSRDLAQTHKIPLTSFAEHTRLDLGIDGADQIASQRLDLVKGLGGALLWEKIVASCCTQFIVMADARKRVDDLGDPVPVPIEIVPFGWEATERKIQTLGAKTSLRTHENGSFFTTDEGNLIIDGYFGLIKNPRTLAQQLDTTTGIIEHGLFLDMANYAIIASAEGTETLTAQR